MTSSRPIARALLGASLLTVLATTGVAEAQPASPPPVRSAGDVAQARELFTQGMAMRTNGDLAGALVKLQAAHELGHTPVTGLELGRTYERLGKLVEAREVLLEVARIPVAAEETAHSARARVDAATMAESLHGRIPSLTIEVAGAPASACTFTLDGAAMSSAAIGAARPVNPGKHVLAATSQGATARQEVSLEETQVRTVTLTLATPPPTAPVVVAPPVLVAPPLPLVVAPVPLPPPAPPAVHEVQHPLRTLGYVSLGVAAVGLGVGAITGGIALSDGSTVKSNCPAGICKTDESSTISSGQTMGTVSTIGFIAAGAFAAFGVYGVLHSVSSEGAPPAATAWQVWAGPMSGGVRGTF